MGCSLFWYQKHTHPFYGPLSGTTRVSQYQKGKTNLDFTEARDSEWRWHQLGHMQACTLLQTDTTPAPHHSVFYRPDALPAAQPTASKHWRLISENCNKITCNVVLQWNVKKCTYKWNVAWYNTKDESNPIHSTYWKNTGPLIKIT